MLQSWDPVLDHFLLHKMAQKLVQLGQKIVVGTPGLVMRVGAKGADVAALARPHLQKFWANAKTEMAPPGPGDMPVIQKEFAALKNSLISGKFLDNTVKQASGKVMVGVEVAFWFFVGEVIGRGSLVGYDV